MYMLKAGRLRGKGVRLEAHEEGVERDDRTCIKIVMLLCDVKALYKYCITCLSIAMLHTR